MANSTNSLSHTKSLCKYQGGVSKYFLPECERKINKAERLVRNQPLLKKSHMIHMISVSESIVGYRLFSFV